MAFVWTKDLETGHSLIDSEHRQLIKAADALIDACGQGKGRQELAGAINFLSNYTKTHFSHEEALMTECKFPDYAMHKSWHQGFIVQIETVSGKLKAEGATISLVAEVNMKLGQLITHIKTLDTKLAQFLKSKGK